MTAGAAGEVRAKAAEAISGRQGSSGSEAWVDCCYCTEEIRGWFSSLAFVALWGSSGGEEPSGWHGLGVSVTNWEWKGDFAFFFCFLPFQIPNPGNRGTVRALGFDPDKTTDRGYSSKNSKGLR